MTTKRLGLIMNGVTGRMGLNQHLIRSIIAIRDQGGVVLANGDRMLPDPILIGRDADKVEWFTADYETAGSDDLCFLTASTPDQVVAHLKANGIAIEEGPVAKQGARGTLRSVYCRDPDGSLIEISSYEDGAA